MENELCSLPRAMPWSHGSDPLVAVDVQEACTAAAHTVLDLLTKKGIQVPGRAVEHPLSVLDSFKKGRERNGKT